MSKKLPLVCSRRALLRGAGAVALVALMPACGTNMSNLSTVKASSCSGGGMCIDLTDPSNQPLATPGTAMLLDTNDDTIMVIRSSPTEVIAVSAICTHAGCAMNFESGAQILSCPCHGSQFAEDGHVLRGPAQTPLRVYTATLANQMITIA